MSSKRVPLGDDNLMIRDNGSEESLVCQVLEVKRTRPESAVDVLCESIPRFPEERLSPPHGFAYFLIMVILLSIAGGGASVGMFELGKSMTQAVDEFSTGEWFLTACGVGVAMGIIAALLRAICTDRWQSVQVTREGIRLRCSSEERLVSFSSIQGIQTYLDQEKGSRGRWGIVLTFARAEAPLTLELGENTGPFSRALSRATGLKAHHTRCEWEPAVET